MPTLSKICYVYRCEACSTEARESLGPSEIARGEALPTIEDNAPSGWKLLVAFVGDDVVGHTVWLCPSCAATPDESRAFVALKLRARLA